MSTVQDNTMHYDDKFTGTADTAAGAAAVVATVAADKDLVQRCFKQLVGELCYVAELCGLRPARILRSP